MPDESFAVNDGLHEIAPISATCAPRTSTTSSSSASSARPTICLGIRFFDAGKKASQAVCRIVIKLGNGRLGFGTGFLVSPSLLLTNHHVLESRR